MKKLPAQKPVTVEDLMKVKRGEHPDREFWSDWDDAMQVKLTQAKSEPRPWYRDALPRLWITVARWQVPVGACAVALLTYSAYKEYHRTLPMSEVEHSSQQIGIAANLPEARPAQTPMLGASTAPVLGGSFSHAPGELSATVASAGSSFVGAVSPAAITIAANLERVIRSEPSILPRIRFEDMLAPQPAAPVPAPASKPQGRAHALGFSYQAAFDATGEAAVPQARSASGLRGDSASQRAASPRPDRSALRF